MPEAKIEKKIRKVHIVFFDFFKPERIPINILMPIFQMCTADMTRLPPGQWQLDETSVGRNFQTPEEVNTPVRSKTEHNGIHKYRDLLSQIKIQQMMLPVLSQLPFNGLSVL